MSVVARWLDEHQVRHVVDLGSGVGKFCVAAALSKGCRFTGIEQRPHLVNAARALAERFGLSDRVRFIEGRLTAENVPAADAYYLFNPFEENRFRRLVQLDDTVELSEERYRQDVATVEELFRMAPPKTKVVKYNGFGGQMPLEYRMLCVDREQPNVLRLWQKW